MTIVFDDAILEFEKTREKLRPELDVFQPQAWEAGEELLAKRIGRFLQRTGGPRFRTP